MKKPKQNNCCRDCAEYTQRGKIPFGDCRHMFKFVAADRKAGKCFKAKEAKDEKL